MIKLVDWTSFKVKLLDSYTTIANDLALLIRDGDYSRTAELRFIILTRYIKTIDLQNIKDDAEQLADGFKDYDEEHIEYVISRINTICGTTLNIPIVYNETLDTPNVLIN